MPDEKTERQLLQEISKKMDTLIGSVAITGRELNDQIKILKSLNFDWNDIGRFVGLKPDAARMRFNSIKSGSASGKAKARATKSRKGAN